MIFRRRPSRTPVKGSLVYRGICRYCGCEAVPGRPEQHDECRRRQQIELDEFLPSLRRKTKRARAPEPPAAGS